MKRGFFSLRRLRWKLTLSYTLVTVVALLMAELLLFAAFIALLSSPVLPGFIVQELKETVVPRVEPALSEVPPDTEALREGVLQEIWLSFDGGNVEQGAGRSGPALGPGDGYLFVVDDEQRLLASDRGLESSIEGKRLDSGQFPGLDPVLTAALEGEEAAWSLTRRLRRLARAARAWSQGDFSVTARDRSKDELGQLSRELNSMAGQLENLLETRGDLATLEARNSIARDLHDSVKQQVFATSLQIAAARALIEQDREAAESHLGRADELVRLAQKELNVLIHQMRPATLEGKGLSAALGDYAAEWSRRSEIPAEVHVRGQREVPLEVEQALFRVAQEALANVARHSGAKSVEVDLVYDPARLMLRVTDDGRGFDPKKNTGDGFGLQSMSERVAMLGGYVDVESAPGKGTRVLCACPLGDSSIEKGRGT